MRRDLRADQAHGRGCRTGPVPAGARRHGEAALHGVRGGQGGRQRRRAARRGRLRRRRLRVPLTMVSTDLLLAEVTGSAGTLAGIAATADLTTTVPTCPDWTLRQLITHVGRAHRWAAAIVATQAAEPIPFREVPDGRLPDGLAERPAWLRDGAARLAETVTAGSGPVWTHFGPGPASYWARRMAHETAVHRADGQIAVGIRPEIDPVVAADGIAEWLGFLPDG